MEKIIEKRGDIMILKDIEGFVPSWKARKDKPESYNKGFDDGVLFIMDELDKCPTFEWHKYPDETPSKPGSYLVVKSIFGHKYTSMSTYVNNLYEYDPDSFSKDLFPSLSRRPGWVTDYEGDSIEECNIIYWMPILDLPKGETD